MSHQTVIMNGGESPLASKLKDRTAAPAYESLPSTHAGSAHMDGGAAPIHGQPPTPTAAAPADPSGVAGVGGAVRPRTKK